MDRIAGPARARRRPYRTMRAGVVLVALGLVVSAGSSVALSLAARLDEHRQSVARLAATSTALRNRASATAAAVQNLDVAWLGYEPEIADVKQRLDADGDGRVLLRFRAAIARQFDDSSLVDALDALPPAIDTDARFGAARAAFRSELAATRDRIASLFARITRVLIVRRYTRGLAVPAGTRADAIAVARLFAGETTLRIRWTALRAAAADVAVNAARDADQEEVAQAEAESKNLIVALIEP